MIETAGTEKLSATVPKGLAAQIRERAGRGNVSAYVTQALLRQLEHDRLGDLVAELEQIHGPVSEDEVAAARSGGRKHEPSKAGSLPSCRRYGPRR